MGGGEVRVIGGWGRYEAERRVAADEDPALGYPGRTYVFPDDAVESLMRGRASNSLQQAADALADALDEHAADSWARVHGGSADHVFCPSLQADDLRKVRAAPEALNALADAVQSLSEELAVECAAVEPVPPARGATAATADAAAVRALEQAVLANVDSVEQAAAALITNMTALTAHLKSREAAVGGGMKLEKPPLHLLERPLPFTGVRGLAADGRIDDAKPVYIGVGVACDRAGVTGLTPHVLEQAARDTSGGRVAWYVVDSSEGRYLVRGNAPLSAAEVAAWVRPRGARVLIKEYLVFLRGRGLTVHAATNARTLLLK
jgi:hypothetical protein